MRTLNHSKRVDVKENKSYYPNQWRSVPRCLPSPTPANIKKLIPGADGLYTLMFFPFLQRLSSSDSTSRIQSNPDNTMQNYQRNPSSKKTKRNQDTGNNIQGGIGCLKVCMDVDVWASGLHSLVPHSFVKSPVSMPKRHDLFRLLRSVISSDEVGPFSR